MDHHAKLVGIALLLLSGAASAFVTPSPPPGFGGSPGSWTFTPASASGQLSSILRGPGPSVAGAAETTAAYRLSGGAAARALAGRAVAGLIPGVGLALAVTWLASNCFEKQGGQWMRTCGGQVPPQSDGFTYTMSGGNATSGPKPSKSAACVAWAAAWSAGSTQYTYSNARPHASNPGCVVDIYYKAGGLLAAGDYSPGLSSASNPSCPAGWYITPAGCVQTVPPATVTQPEIEAEMETKPLPQTLPPGVPYPLDPLAPAIWNPTIGDPPVTQPLRVPQGNPVPIPNTNPQQYRQPVTEWTHSPTATDPWRMDVQPKDVVSNSPTGQTGPTSVTSGSPPATADEQPDLCKLNPDIVACQKLGNLDALPVPNENKQLGITPDTGWDHAAGCPAPKTVVFLGKSWSFPWTLFCNFASMIKPLLIGFAWLSAALTFFGLGRKGE